MSETAELARLAMGRRAGRRQRLSRAMLARLIGDRYEAEDEDFEGEEGTGQEDRRIARLLIGSRLLRRRRLRNLLLAHLLRERSETDDESDEGEEGWGEEDSDKERHIVRLLIGSRMLRRRRVRRMLLAHLLRERGEAEEEDEEGEGEDEFAAEGDRDRRLLKLLIGSRILHRRRARRMLLAHLLREKGEAGEEEDEGEDEFAEGGDKEKRLLRLLTGHRMRQRKRARRMLMTHLLREREEA